MPGKRSMVLALIGASLAACAANTGPKEATGTVTGAAAGALVGNMLAGSGNRLAGTLIGAAVGGFLGNRVDATLDDEDRRRADAARMQALASGPSGAPVAWRNPDSGRYGNVVPGPAYQANGATCRGYTQTIYVDGTPQASRSTACQNPDGSWTVVD